MFIDVFFLIAPNPKSINRRMGKNLWYIHRIECFLLIERNKLLMYTMTWMILKNIMLNKGSQTQNCTYYVIPFTLIQTSKINIVKKVRNVVASEREGLIGKEHELILWGAECFLYCLHRCMHVGKQTELYSYLCASLCKYVCYLLKRTKKIEFSLVDFYFIVLWVSNFETTFCIF